MLNQPDIIGQLNKKYEDSIKEVNQLKITVDEQRKYFEKQVNAIKARMIWLLLKVGD